MNDNPYAPPVAPVTDVEPAQSLERPRIVVLAVRTLWAAFFLALPVAIYGVIVPDPGTSRMMSLILTIFGVGISFAIALWLNTAAWKGRGYARWVMAVLTLLGFATLSWLYSLMPEVFKTPWFIQAFNVVSNILMVAGNLMLFAPSANAWYREMKRWR
jgi:hypothetical protein